MRIRILVVEDESELRDLCKVVLGVVADWRVLTAKSGEEALRMAPLWKPHVILLDVAMPGLDGPETLHRLRKHPDLASVPVAFFTAGAAERREYLALGATEVIRKPFLPETLPAKIREILDLVDDAA